MNLDDELDKILQIFQNCIAVGIDCNWELNRKATKQAIKELIKEELDNLLDDFAVSEKHPRDVVTDRIEELKDD